MNENSLPRLLRGRARVNGKWVQYENPADIARDILASAGLPLTQQRREETLDRGLPGDEAADPNEPGPSEDDQGGRIPETEAGRRRTNPADAYRVAYEPVGAEFIRCLPNGLEQNQRLQRVQEGVFVEWLGMVKCPECGSSSGHQVDSTSPVNVLLYTLNGVHNIPISKLVCQCNHRFHPKPTDLGCLPANQSAWNPALAANRAVPWFHGSLLSLLDALMCKLRLVSVYGLAQALLVHWTAMLEVLDLPANADVAAAPTDASGSCSTPPVATPPAQCLPTEDQLQRHLSQVLQLYSWLQRQGAFLCEQVPGFPSTVQRPCAACSPGKVQFHLDSCFGLRLVRRPGYTLEYPPPPGRQLFVANEVVAAFMAEDEELKRQHQQQQRNQREQARQMTQQQQQMQREQERHAKELKRVERQQQRAQKQQERQWREQQVSRRTASGSAAPMESLRWLPERKRASEQSQAGTRRSARLAAAPSVQNQDAGCIDGSATATTAAEAVRAAAASAAVVATTASAGALPRPGRAAAAGSALATMSVQSMAAAAAGAGPGPAVAGASAQPLTAASEPAASAANYNSRSRREAEEHGILPCSEFRADQVVAGDSNKYLITAVTFMICRHGHIVTMLNCTGGEKHAYGLLCMKLLLLAGIGLACWWYDINCRWQKSLHQWCERQQDPELIDRIKQIIPRLKCPVPPWHLSAHVPRCRVEYGHLFMEGVGRGVGEVAERINALLAHHGLITQYNSPENREARLERAGYEINRALDANLPATLVSMMLRAEMEGELVEQDLKAMQEALADVLLDEGLTDQADISERVNEMVAAAERHMKDTRRQPDMGWEGELAKKVVLADFMEQAVAGRQPPPPVLLYNGRDVKARVTSADARAARIAAEQLAAEHMQPPRQLSYSHPVMQRGFNKWVAAEISSVKDTLNAVLALERFQESLLAKLGGRAQDKKKVLAHKAKLSKQANRTFKQPMDWVEWVGALTRTHVVQQWDQELAQEVGRLAQAKLEDMQRSRSNPEISLVPATVRGGPAEQYAQQIYVLQERQKRLQEEAELLQDEKATLVEHLETRVQVLEGAVVAAQGSAAVGKAYLLKKELIRCKAILQDANKLFSALARRDEEAAAMVAAAALVAMADGAEQGEEGDEVLG